MRLTTVAQTVVDCATSRPLREAVVIADSALRSQQITPDELWALRLPVGHRGAARLRRVLSLVDPGCGSVLESVLRVLMVLDGLHPMTQVTLFGADGHRIGIFDFWFRSARLVVECDGHRWHDPLDVRERDRWRDIEAARIGCRTVRFSWDDVLRRPEQVLAAIRECLVIAA